MSTRNAYLAFRRTQPPPARLTRRDVEARGLTFAVWQTPEVPRVLPLVCVHGGLLFDHTLLWPALAPLAQTRQLILYDQRGRGESSVPPGIAASRIEFDAGDLVALRDALGLTRWDMFGHSWGGGIALQAAAQDVGGVRRLVLANAVGITGEWLPPLHARAVDRLARTGQAAAAETLAALDPLALGSPDLAVHIAYTRAFFPAWFADPAFAERAVPPTGHSVTGAHVAARLRRDGYDWSARVGGLRCPTLVLHGAEDVLPLSVANHTVAVLSAQGVSAQLQPMPGAGHNPFWEAAAAFFAAIEAFLSAPP